MHKSSRTKKYKSSKFNEHREKFEHTKEFPPVDALIKNNWKIRVSCSRDYSIQLTCQKCGRVRPLKLKLDMVKAFYERYRKEEYICIICE